MLCADSSFSMRLRRGPLYRYSRILFCAIAHSREILASWPGEHLPKHSAPPCQLIRKQNRVRREAIGSAFQSDGVLQRLGERGGKKIQGFEKTFRPPARWGVAAINFLPFAVPQRENPRTTGIS